MLLPAGRRRSAEHRPAAGKEAGAELLVEVAPVPGELVEDQCQAERQLLVLEARVGGEDGLLAQVRGGLLDDRAVGAQLLVVRHCCSPELVATDTPGGSGL